MKQSPEGVAKVVRTERVNKRVDGRVAVSEPEEDAEDDRRRAVLAERAENIDGEERRPAKDETADNDADRLGGFLLAVETAQLVFDVEQTAP